jgi:phage gpG-like protein
MAKPMDIMGMVNFIKEAPEAMDRALGLAQVVTIQRAEVQARLNAQKNFGHTKNGNRLTGGLNNAIFSGYEKGSGSNVPTAFLGTQGIPYGAIHEYGSEGLPGGVIRPVKAQKLWIPARGNAGRMTPREFIALMKAQPNRYFITDKGAFKEEAPNVFTPLFYRVDQVRIPARPYLTPAIETAYATFADTFERFYAQELAK